MFVEEGNGGDLRVLLAEGEEPLSSPTNESRKVMLRTSPETELPIANSMQDRGAFEEVVLRGHLFLGLPVQPTLDAYAVVADVDQDVRDVHVVAGIRVDAVGVAVVPRG